MDNNEHCGLFAEYNAITLLQLFNISSDMGSDSTTDVITIDALNNFSWDE